MVSAGSECHSSHLLQPARVTMGRRTGGPPNPASRSWSGAVLTQNTAWRNVEKAITALREAGDAGAGTYPLPVRFRTWGELLRPSGYFNVKARRLKSLCTWLVHAGRYRGAIFRS